MLYNSDWWLDSYTHIWNTHPICCILTFACKYIKRQPLHNAICVANMYINIEISVVIVQNLAHKVTLSLWQQFSEFKYFKRKEKQEPIFFNGQNIFFGMKESIYNGNQTHFLIIQWSYCLHQLLQIGQN